MSAEYSDFSGTVDQLVQQTTADKFQDLGWESIFAYNEETLGETGEVLLKRDRRPKKPQLTGGFTVV